MHSHYILPWEKKDAVYTPRSKGSAEFIFPYKWRPVLLTFFQLRSDLFIFTHLQEMGIFQSIILSPGKQFVLLNHGQRQISHSLHVLPQKIFFNSSTISGKRIYKHPQCKFCFLNLFQKAWETLLNPLDDWYSIVGGGVDRVLRLPSRHLHVLMLSWGV